MTTILTAFGIFLVTFLLRGSPRFGKTLSLGSDVFANLALIEEVRRARHRIPDRLSLVLTGGYFSVPSAMYVLLSFFSRKIVEKWIEPCWGAFLDGLQSVVLYIAALHIFTHYLPTTSPSTAAALSALLFVSTPVLVRQTAGQFFLSARPLGNLLFTCAALSTILFLWSAEIRWLVFALTAMCLACMSSKFTVQAIVLVAAVVLAGGRLWLPIALFVVAEVIAVIITRGRHLRVLRHHVGHLWLYMTRLQFRHRIINLHKSLSDRLFYVLCGRLRQAFQEFEGVDWSSPISVLKKLVRFVEQTPEVRGMIQFPALVLLIYVLFASDFPLNSYQRQLAGWVVSGVILLLLTSIRCFRFLGEPDRYLGYIVVPASILLSSFFMEGRFPAMYYIICLMVGLVVMLINFAGYLRLVKGTLVKEDLSPIAERLQEIPSTHILCVPTLIGKELMYRVPRHRYLCFSGYNLGSTPETREEFEYIFPDVYPFPREDLRGLAQRYACRYLVAKRRILEERVYDLSQWERVFQDSGYELYKHSS